MMIEAIVLAICTSVLPYTHPQSVSCGKLATRCVPFEGEMKEFLKTLKSTND